MIPGKKLGEIALTACSVTLIPLSILQANAQATARTDQSSNPSSVVLLPFLGGSIGFGQQDFSKQTVQALHIEGWGLADVMSKVASQTQITIGVELDVVMGTEGHVELNFDGGTVADLAQKCVALTQGVSWKIVNNHSLLIYLPGRATSFSATQVQYHGVTGATRRQVWEDLSDHPEIESWLRSKNCKRMNIWSGDPWRGDGPSISIPRGGITLGDILETAASKSDNHFWSILGNSREGQCEMWISLW
jgi:hypothetical protein